MKQAYQTIAGRIHGELEELVRVVERTICIWQQAGVSADDYYVDAVALNLHSFYAGLERLLTVIADGVDRITPSGPHWHQELLRQLTAEIRGVRPRVLSLQTRNRLDRYRGFRHVVRNAYAFSFDDQQIDLLVRQLVSTMDQVSEELLAFARFLEQLGEDD